MFANEWTSWSLTVNLFTSTSNKLIRIFENMTDLAHTLFLDFGSLFSYQRRTN